MTKACQVNFFLLCMNKIGPSSQYVLFKFIYLLFTVFFVGFFCMYTFLTFPFLLPSCLSFFETRFLCKVLSWNLLCRPWPRTRRSAYLCFPSAGIKHAHHHTQHCLIACVWQRLWVVLESCKCTSLWSWRRKSFLITSHTVYWEKSSHWTSNKTIQACLDSQITPRILSLSPQCWAYKQLLQLPSSSLAPHTCKQALTYRASPSPAQKFQEFPTAENLG